MLPPADGRHLLALDLSPTNAGVAHLRRQGGAVQIETERVAVPPLRVPGARAGTERNCPRRGAERLHWWEKFLIEEIADGVTLVVMEGYSYGSQTQGQREKAEMYGVIRLACHKRDVGLIEVPPAKLKQFATGRGNAQKPEMYAAAVARFGEGIGSHDEADAAWLMAWALENTAI